MNINELLSLLRKKDIRIWLEGDLLKFDSPKGAVTKEIRNLLILHKEELVNSLRSLESKSETDPVLPVLRNGPLPVSFAQERIWYTCQFAEYSPLYNMILAYELKGKIDPQRLQHAVNLLVENNEILRSGFSEIGGAIKQIIHPAVSVPVFMEEYGGTLPEARNAFTARLKVEEKHTFDLKNEVLLRIGLIKAKQDKWFLWLNIHHIISDGWSSNIIFKALIGYYSHDKKEDAASVQFADYVMWERNKLTGTGDHYAGLLSFWKKYLEEVPGIIQLPLQRSRTEKQAYTAGVERITVPAKIVTDLNDHAAHIGATPFMVFLSAFAELIFRYTNEQDIVIGTAVANRRNKQAEALLGCFMNMLPVRMKQEASLTFARVVEQTRANLVSVYEHQEMPFNMLVDEVNPRRTLSYNPLVQIMFNMNTIPVSKTGAQGIEFTPFDRPAPASGNYDLNLEVKQEAEAYTAHFTYNAALFDATFISGFAHHFVNILGQVAKDFETPVREIRILTTGERDELLGAWTGPSVKVEEITLHGLVERSAKAHPGTIALVSGNERITYHALNAKANTFAHYLINKKGISIGDTVGVLMDRSVDMVICLLGILKAGACYLPLDPAAPSGRIDYIVKDSGVKLVVVKPGPDPFPGSQMHVLVYDEIEATAAGHDPSLNIRPDHLAYMIYTSGSSGAPKGTLIEHGNVINFLYGMNERFGTGAGTMLSVTSVSFDIAVLELFWTLVNGFKVILHNTDLRNLTGERSNAAGADKMDFSLFYFSSVHSEKDNTDSRYKLLLDGARFADAHGFTAVWTPERHFHGFGGLYPNPSVTGAAVAAVTRNIGIRAGSVVLPLHHPLRVTEEWSVVDNISGGRVGISFASGWQVNDFVLSPGTYADKQNFYQMIRDVCRLWKGESLPFRNGNDEIVHTRIFPKPVQPELPLWITASGNPETFREAGAMGANILTHLMSQTVDELDAKIRVYKEARKQHGHDPEAGKISLMLHTYIGDAWEKIREIVYIPFTQYLRTSVDLMKSMAEANGIDLKGKNLSPEVMDLLIPKAFDRYVNTASLIGTPEKCAEMIGKVSAIGVNEVCCLIDFGVEHGAVMEGLKHLARLKDNLSDGLTIADQIGEHHVTHFQCTPSMAELLLTDTAARHALSKVQKFFVGGENLSAALANEIGDVLAGGQLFNMYGPTETTIWSSTGTVMKGREVSIGHPIVNTSFFILDRFMQPVPEGVTGELYIGGQGLARGYFSRPALTAEKFIDHQFGKNKVRLYKTGDLVKTNRQKEIIYVGRADQQVKINGHRIELDEIRHVVAGLDDVKQCVVLKTEHDNKPRLVAYAVLKQKDSITGARLRDRLRSLLPSYMIPSVVYCIDEIPLLPSGKTDLKRLREIDPVAGETRELQAPASRIEAVLVEAWKQVLGTEHVGVEDNFFELGGDSIRSIQIVSKIREAGINLTLNQLYEFQTIRELAKVANEGYSMDEFQGLVEGIVPLTPIQQWFFEQNLAQPDHYNQAIMLDVPADLKPEILQQAIRLLASHHDALRMQFVTKDQVLIQENRSEAEIIFEAEDLSPAAGLELAEMLREKTSEVHAKITLRNAPAAIKLFRMGDHRPGRLLIVVHHLVVDGISWRILLEDLYHVYENLNTGRAFELQPKTASFKKWAEHLAEYASSSRLKNEIQYWKERPYERITPLLPDYDDYGPNTVGSESSITVDLDKGLTRSLQTDLPRNHKTQINDALLTALLLSFKAWTGRNALLIDLEGHGREPLFKDVDVSRSVGWFTSMYPVLLTADAGENLTGVLRSVKGQLRDIPDNGIGYGMLRYLSHDTELKDALKAQPRPQIVFNYLGHTDQAFLNWPQSSESIGQAHSPLNERSHLIDIVALVKDDKLQVIWRYSKNIFKPATIKLLANKFTQTLEELIIHSLAAKAKAYTPSDFPLAGIDQPSLDKLVEQFHELTTALPDDIYRLSPMQEGILFHILENPSADDYFQQFRTTVKGDVFPERLKQAWEELVRAHDIFRTSFHWNDLQEPLQIVQESAPARWNYVDYSGDTEAGSANRMEEFLLEERYQKFDLRQAPLIKATLFRLNEATFVFNLSYYHLLLDGWSLPIVFNEVFKNYNSNARQNKKKASPLRYKDYIRWQQQQDKEAAKQFWTANLRGFTTPTTFPGLKTNNYLGRNIPHATIGKTLGPSLSSRIKDLTRKHKITMGTFFHGIWGFLLSAYAGENDVVFGATFSGRPSSLSDVVNTIGLFICTLPIRIKMEPTRTVQDWLLQAQRSQQECEQYGYLPLTDIRNNTDLPAGAPLFDSIMVIENYPMEDITQHHAAVSISRFESFEQTNYPCTIVVVPGDEVVVKCIYDSLRIEDDFVTNLLEKVEQTAEAFLSGMEKPLSQIRIITGEEEQRLLDFGRGETLDVPAAQTVAGLFQDQASKTPAGIALRSGDRKFTFGELDEASSQLAHFLIDTFGIKPGDLAGVMLERNEWLVISLLAVLKTGAAYVPVDLAYPESRKDYIRQDSHCKITIDGAVIADFEMARHDVPASPLNIRISEQAPAYVIYTSGSTGNPKGVVISHASCCSFIGWCRGEFSQRPFDVIYAVTSICFDLSIFEIFYPLSEGKTIRLLASVPEIETYCNLDSNILLNTVPSVVYALQKNKVDFRNIAVLNMAGEPIPRKIVEGLDLNNIEVRNLYGPSEYTTYTTAFRITSADKVLIGKPIANARIYIVDADLNLAPYGAAGEICIAGPGLATGYHNRLQLTANSFIKNPFEPGARMYRTGDFGKWTADGNIEFLGRKDSQVKIRGNRIELGEIETVLGKHPSVSEVVVLATQASPNEKGLVAFIVASALTEASVFRNYLREQLPEYMIPAQFVEVKTLPRTPNGKVDALALLSNNDLVKRDALYRAPGNEIELRLIKVWEELLQVENIGIDNNFFELGGQSLKAIRLMSICQKLFNVKLPLHDILRHPTIQEMASVIVQAARNGYQRIPAVPLRAHYPISEAQRPLWVMSQFEEGTKAYNISMAMKLTGNLDVESFRQAFDHLVERHEVLRTVFRENERGEPSQWILPATEINFRLEYEDLGLHADRELLTQTRISELTYHLFDLQQGPLIRALLIKTAQAEYVLCFCIHHLISDGWSLEVISRDVMAAYAAIVKNVPVPLPPLRIQYKDYTAWLQEQLQGASLMAHRDYWMNRFRGELPVLDFPAQKLRPLVRTYHGSALRIGFPQDAVSRLRQHSQASGGTLFMGILTCLKGFLGRYTSQDDIILGSSIAGQEHADLADQAGFYVNTVALRTQFDRTNSFHELFVKVRETLLGAFEHRLYPLHRLIDDLGLKKGLGRSPLFDIVVSYEGVSYLSSSAIPELPGLEMSLIEREHRLARFDITFGFIERPDGLVLDIEYNTDIHERHMMEQFGKHFRQFVENAAASPDQPLNTVVYMSEAEQVQVTSVFNSTTVAYPISQTLIHVFFAQAGKTPDNIAVQAGEMTLTYSELDAITNRFARYLAEKMFGDPNELIAIKLERDAWLIVSILAVLKSGNAYLPIDPAYSQLRIDYIMESSNCQITIDKDMIDDFISEQQNYSGDEMPEKPSPSDLAYVIYTSGSTGHPKGVMIEHKSILNTILSQIELFEITAADHCLQFASQSFDASVSEIFVTLLSGAQLSIVNEMEKRDISLFSAYLREKAISWATIPPAYIKMLEPETLNAVNKIVTAGEQAYVNKALMSRKSGYYINAYGPTETSICAAVYKGPVRPSMPIGKPIHNTRIYILDDFGTIVPVGITGEIHIAGAGLARGYLKRRDLTEASFMADPFNPGEKFYKTGDFGRWLPDGTIEFTGRRDTQVKVNGYRIELEEIENVLTSLNEWVSQVALDVREVKHEKVIVAYVVGKKELDKIALRDAIAQQLPAYMIPNYFVEVAEIPLNQSGKVDRKALPEVQSDDVLQAEYVAPANETEHKLAEIWQEVLALDKVGTTDKFFDIGGTSLKLIELHKRINEAFNTQINIVTLFRKPTIGEIGKELQESVSNLSNQPDNVVNVIPFENEG